MKKTWIGLFSIVILCGTFGVNSAGAVEKVKQVSSPAPKTQTLNSQEATTTTTLTTVEQTYPWGLGVATANLVTETVTAVTAWIGFDDHRAIQVYFGLDSTSPFNVGGGALFKQVVAGNMSGGLHLGAGFGMGTRGAQEKFFTRLTGVAGMHFELPGIRNVFIQADVGPSLLLVSGNTSFSISAFSPLLGLSMIYMF